MLVTYVSCAWFRLWDTIGTKYMMKVKEKREKAGLKLSIQKTKIKVSDPITSWPQEGKKWKQ